MDNPYTDGLLIQTVQSPFTLGISFVNNYAQLNLVRQLVLPYLIDAFIETAPSLLDVVIDIPLLAIKKLRSFILLAEDSGLQVAHHIERAVVQHFGEPGLSLAASRRQVNFNHPRVHLLIVNYVEPVHLKCIRSHLLSLLQCF